jgi:hypothetical protein
MRVIVAAILTSVLFALLAGAGYMVAQEPVYRAQPMPSVRVGDPGENLVGENWNGNPADGRQKEGS